MSGWSDVTLDVRIPIIYWELRINKSSQCVSGELAPPSSGLTDHQPLHIPTRGSMTTSRTNTPHPIIVQCSPHLKPTTGHIEGAEDYLLDIMLYFSKPHFFLWMNNIRPVGKIEGGPIGTEQMYCISIFDGQISIQDLYPQFKKS